MRDLWSMELRLNFHNDYIGLHRPEHPVNVRRHASQPARESAPHLGMNVVKKPTLLVTIIIPQVIGVDNTRRYTADRVQSDPCARINSFLSAGRPKPLLALSHVGSQPPVRGSITAKCGW
jgi:hypothetical protein